MWSGDVDDNLEILLQPSGISYRTLRGAAPRGVQSAVNRMPRTDAELEINQTEGRGQIVVDAAADGRERLHGANSRPRSAAWIRALRVQRDLAVVSFIPSEPRDLQLAQGQLQIPRCARDDRAGPESGLASPWDVTERDAMDGRSFERGYFLTIVVGVALVIGAAATVQAQRRVFEWSGRVDHDLEITVMGNAFVATRIGSNERLPARIEHADQSSASGRRALAQSRGRPRRSRSRAAAGVGERIHRRHRTSRSRERRRAISHRRVLAASRGGRSRLRCAVRATGERGGT